MPLTKLLAIDIVHIYIYIYMYIYIYILGIELNVDHVFTTLGFSQPHEHELSDALENGCEHQVSQRRSRLGALFGPFWLLRGYCFIKVSPQAIDEGDTAAVSDFEGG